tara:strand:+ start:2321 stop:2590 length:270 start_codon:yes stop_codon:yes gene_type:complete
MSHWVNDRIVDDAIDFVANLDDDAVCNAVNFDYGIKMYDVKNALIDHKIGLKNCKWCKDCKGHWDMDSMRDLLVSLTFDNLMSRPGPHG